MSRDIRLQRIRYLRGPNIWTYRPVLETWLDLGELEEVVARIGVSPREVDEYLARHAEATLGRWLDRAMDALWPRNNQAVYGLRGHAARATAPRFAGSVRS